MAMQLTMTLVHSVWFVGAVSLASMIGSWILRSATAQARYLLHTIALATMLVSMPVIFALVEVGDIESAARRASRVAGGAGSHGEFDHGPSADVADSSSGAGSDDGPRPGAPPSETPAADGGEPRARLVILSMSLAAWAPRIAGVYLLGVGIMFLRLGTAVWGGRRLRQAAVAVQDAAVLAMVQRQVRRIGGLRVPFVAWCERITVPVVTGLLRPAILLPVSLATGMPAAQWEVLLAHELAHIRRFDLLANFLQRVVEAALFFHPGAWYVSWSMARERENACDDLVLAGGWPPITYAETLLRMAELGRHGPRDWKTSPEFLAATGDSPSQFKRRLLRVLGYEPATSVYPSAGGLVWFSVAMVLTFIAPVAFCTRGEQRLAWNSLLAHQNKESPAAGANNPADPRSAHASSPVRPERTAEKYGELLVENQFGELAEKFTPLLNAELSAEGLGELWKDLSTPFGKLKRFRRARTRRVGNRNVIEQLARWDRAEWTLVLLLDDSGRIEGLGIRDEPERGDLPETRIPKGGLDFGPELRAQRAATGSITTQVKDRSGNPIQSGSYRIWKENPRPGDRDGVWRTSDGAVWEPLEQRSGVSPVLFGNLPAGRYRISGQFPLPDGFRTAFTGPIVLATDQATSEATLEFFEGGTIKFRLIDALTGAPIEDGWCGLTRVQRDWPETMFPPRRDPEAGVWSVAGLPPGKYQLNAGRRPDSPDAPVYELVDGPLEIEAPRGGVTEKRDLALRGRSMTESEVSACWPWTVEGTVRDTGLWLLDNAWDASGNRVVQIDEVSVQLR